MGFKIVLNQIRKVRIDKVEDKEILNQAKKDEEVILQLKETINLIFNIIIEKKYGNYKSECRAQRSNERNFHANVIEGKSKNSKTLLLAYSATIKG